MTTHVNGSPLPAMDSSAERMTLGAALNSPGDVAELRTLAPEDFTPGRHQLTYRAILSVANRDLPVTVGSVVDELVRDGHDDAHLFIADLYAQGIPGTARDYGELVTRAARNRKILAGAQRLAQLAGLEPTDENHAHALDIALGLAQDIEGTAVTLDLQALRHERDVAAETRKLRARADAARVIAREQRGNPLPPAITLGTQFFTEPDEPVNYRLDQLWPTGGRVLLAAQYKAGKTTIVNNLVRSLVDAEPFLDHYPVTRQARRVVLADNELDRGMLRRWLREQHIQRTDGFAVLPLRGHLSSFDILDPAVRTEWARQLRDTGADVFILDCLRPLMDALGLDENHDAGRILTAVDELLGQAGIPEAVIIHHMGHTGERARGDSRLRDWPDVEWRLIREDPDDPASPRYFTAFGRDVEQPETALTYDPDTRRLVLATGNRKDAVIYRDLDALIDLIGEADPTGQGLSQRQIISHAMTAGIAAKGLIPKMLSAGQTQGLLNHWKGPRAAEMYSTKIIATVHSSTAPDCPGAVDPMF